MFQGREWIAELGIYDYRHRMYHPGLGRFLQTDPMGLQTEGAKLSAEQKALFSPGGVAPDAFTSSEMNLYRYCGDDPVDRSDPLGLEFIDGGYGFTSEPSPADYGYTTGRIETHTATRAVDGGYAARVLQIDLKVHSTIRTTTKQSYDPTWNHQGADLFRRDKQDLNRSIHHEGLHRHNNKEWYDQNHAQLTKSLNAENTVYKTREQAERAIQSKVDAAYRQFSQPDTAHSSPAWKDWEPPAYEHPVIVRPSFR
jgi:hypothetical protein